MVHVLKRLEIKWNNETRSLDNIRGVNASRETWEVFCLFIFKETLLKLKNDVLNWVGGSEEICRNHKQNYCRVLWSYASLIQKTRTTSCSEGSWTFTQDLFISPNSSIRLDLRTWNVSKGPCKSLFSNLDHDLDAWERFSDWTCSSGFNGSFIWQEFLRLLRLLTEFKFYVDMFIKSVYKVRIPHICSLVQKLHV